MKKYAARYLRCYPPISSAFHRRYRTHTQIQTSIHSPSTLRFHDFRMNSGLQNRNAEKRITTVFIYGPTSWAKQTQRVGDIVYDEADIEISIFIWQFTHVSCSQICRKCFFFRASATVVACEMFVLYFLDLNRSNWILMI